MMTIHLRVCTFPKKLVMDSQTKLVCKPLKTNSTESIPGWEGIPEATVMNALIATVSLIILSIVRIIYFKWKPYENDWNIRYFSPLPT